MKPDFDQLSWPEAILLLSSLTTLCISLAYLLFSI